MKWRKGTFRIDVYPGRRSRRYRFRSRVRGRTLACARVRTFTGAKRTAATLAALPVDWTSTDPFQGIGWNENSPRARTFDDAARIVLDAERDALAG